MWKYTRMKEKGFIQTIKNIKFVETKKPWQTSEFVMTKFKVKIKSQT